MGRGLFAVLVVVKAGRGAADATADREAQNGVCGLERGALVGGEKGSFVCVGVK